MNPASAERCDCGRSFIDGTIGLQLKDRLAAPGAFAERPAGLTILAILNMVFGGLGAIWLVSLIQLVAESSDKPFDAPEFFYPSLALSVITLVLLVAAGVGYFMQKRWGLIVGNAYAAFALLSVLIALVVVRDVPIRELVVGVAYPILTVVFINTRFKRALVN